MAHHIETPFDLRCESVTLDYTPLLLYVLKVIKKGKTKLGITISIDE